MLLAAKLGYMTAQSDAAPTAWRSPAEAATQLRRLADEFPAFHIAMETTADYRVRFIARNRYGDVHPRMVMTPDAAELRDALSASTGQPSI
jgi:hypothetical protein